ncbi:MAG: 4Fe-4S dicluster domain-containing protein [Candidatus Thorarchaeota archaeon]
MQLASQVLFRYEPSKCVRCGMCVEVCPFDVWELPEEGPAVITRGENCTNCTACAKNCLGNAINVKNIGCGCLWYKPIEEDVSSSSDSYCG